jgi:Sec-independent protein translocase protein TatA
MMSRRSLLALMGASVILLGANATPVQAPVLGGNMKKFRDRQAAKKRAKKEKIEKEKEEQKEEKKSGE